MKRIHTWKERLRPERTKLYFRRIEHFLVQEEERGKIVYPAQRHIFRAFLCTPLHRVRVVVLGQDPYCGFGQADGLAFSVPQGVSIPWSLRNVYTEIRNDIGDFPVPRHGDLQNWSAQGVLLLNSILTVEENQAFSHAHIGWERFTDAVIRTINRCCRTVVFLLWGKRAQTKHTLIDPTRHRVLFAAHPSPRSAHRGFFGCRHFSQTNAYLSRRNAGIDWARVCRP